MKDYEEMAKSVLSRRDNYVMERKKRMRKVVSIGSCFCLMLLVGVGIYQSNNLAPAGDALTNVTQGVVDMGADKQQKKAEDIDDNPGGYSSPATDVYPGGDMSGETDPMEISDAPVTGNPGSTGALNPLDEIWGGSYMDQSGHWVVWLTENTQENQARVFAQNPDLLEDDTVFKTADFSLSYLTDLLANISVEMGTQKLPFVTTAALREQDNRVEVTMTTDDEEYAAQVLNFDTIGGGRHRGGPGPAAGQRYAERQRDHHRHQYERFQVLGEQDGGLSIHHGSQGYVVFCPAFL